MFTSSRAPIGLAVVLLAGSVALLWMPWFPLNPRVECGWTCYVPLQPGEKAPTVLQLTGRGGHAVAGLASTVTILAAIFAVAVAVAATRRHLPRLAAVSLVVLGAASLVATTAAAIRITGADFILVSGPGPDDQVGSPAVGPGALLAFALGCVIALLGLRMLRPPRRARASPMTGRAGSEIGTLRESD